MSRKSYLRIGWGVAAAATCSLAVVAMARVYGSLTPSAIERFHSIEIPPVAGPNILLICVDTLRADHVGLYGYHRATTPSIDAFFGSRRVYEMAYASAPSTGPSVISMLTGLYPHHHGVRLLCQKISPNVITVTDHLARAGYQTAAVISNAVLGGQASGLGERFDYYDDQVDEQEPFRDHMFERKAERTTDAAIHWLTKVRQSNKPHFLWVHYIDPHGPYRPPDEKPVDFSHESPVTIDPQRVPAYARELGVTDGLEYVDRYDEEIAYVDQHVGRLLDAYTRLGLVKDAFIIFTSDHGESMMEHEYWFRHGRTLYEEMVRVPLMIRHHSISAAREPVAVSLVDLAPTILYSASLPIPPELDGVNLLPRARPRDLLIESRSSHPGLERALIRKGRKTVARHGMSNIVRESFAYDLINDPSELHRLVVSPDDPVLGILTELISNDPHPGGFPPEYDRGELPGPNVAPIGDPQLHDRLRSLGYVGDPTP